MTTKDEFSHIETMQDMWKPQTEILGRIIPNLHKTFLYTANEMQDSFVIFRDALI